MSEMLRLFNRGVFFFWLLFELGLLVCLLFFFVHVGVLSWLIRI